MVNRMQDQEQRMKAEAEDRQIQQQQFQQQQEMMMMMISNAMGVGDNFASISGNNTNNTTIKQKKRDSVADEDEPVVLETSPTKKDILEILKRQDERLKEIEAESSVDSYSPFAKKVKDVVDDSKSNKGNEAVGLVVVLEEATALSPIRNMNKFVGEQ